MTTCHFRHMLYAACAVRSVGPKGVLALGECWPWGSVGPRGVPILDWHDGRNRVPILDGHDGPELIGETISA